MPAEKKTREGKGREGKGRGKKEKFTLFSDHNGLVPVLMCF